MQGRKKNIGPPLDWLREERERAERNQNPTTSFGGGGQACSRGDDDDRVTGSGRAEDTSNDWECSDCGNRNFARRSECFKCGGAKRGSWSRSRSPSQSWSREAPKGGHGKGGQSGAGRSKFDEDTSHDWHCEPCGTRNFARRNVCFKCGAPQPHSCSRSRSRSRGAAVGRGKGGKGPGGGKGDCSGGSRALFASARERPRSRSAGSNSSRSSSKSQPKKVRARFGAGLWDSMHRVPDFKPCAQPHKKPQGLVVDINAKVNIQGLKGAPQYNGCEGKVTNGPNEKGRWLVQLIFAGAMKELALLPENLEPKPSCGWELVAGGLSMSTTEQDVVRVFARFGQVQRTTITRDLNGISKGVALVVMSHKASAEGALAVSHEIDVCGIPAKVQWSTMVKQEMGLLKTRDEENEGDLSARRQFQESRDTSEAGTRASVEPQDMSSSEFHVGKEVLVTGLKSAQQFNGVRGCIQGFRSDGRCEVALACDAETRILALKVENLVDV